MIVLLNDLSYIPPNEQNEPTQAKRNEFEELYASSNEELYPGCDYVTRLDFMAKFTYFKVKDGQSTVVDPSPNIIDVPDEDDDIIGDEDALPHDLADSDVEDDGVEKVYSSEEED
ncbi:hypothetical protein Tco_0167068 [Tanacetum coccineum]